MAVIGCKTQHRYPPDGIGKCRFVKTQDSVGLSNGLVELRFSASTGALVSLKNLATGDEYLKGAGGDGNPFRGYVDTKSMPPDSNLGWAASARDVEGSMGGQLADPRDCKLIHFSCKRVRQGGELCLELQHDQTGLLFELKVTLTDHDVAVDTKLSVKNSGKAAPTLMTAFPYFTGLSLGADPKTNLGIRMFGQGLSDEPAWINSGGSYGYQVSMQWQSVYESSLDEGLAFIVMDPEVRTKILRRFAGGGMSALYFPAKTLRPGEKIEYPPVQLLIHQGDWKFAAHRYREWFAKTFKPRVSPEWWSEVDIMNSLWIPRPEAVETSKKGGHGIRSFRELPGPYYLRNQVDLFEWAMYWDGMRQHPESFGAFGPDGSYHPRQDLGGADAMRDAIGEIHRVGRRAMLYVAGRGLHRTSDLFAGLKDGVHVNAQGKESRHGDDMFMCPGYVPWQDQLARSCRRLLKETGADGIRLDELGMPFSPCFSGAHPHENPFDGLRWNRELLRKVRKAIDEVNPQAILTTEYFCDYFNESTNGALLMVYPGHGLEPMRIAIPTYRGSGYHPGAIETGMNGWIGGSVEAKRRSFPWAGQPGFPAKPENFGDDRGKILRWHELRPTFLAALWHGEVYDSVPFAPEDGEWIGRLWKATNYSLLLGGHLDGTPLSGPTRIRLPGLPANLSHAFEFDTETLALKRTELTRVGGQTDVEVTAAFSAVLFPSPSCPPLVQIEGELPTLKQGTTTEILCRAFTPWSSKRNQLIEIKIPGLNVEPTSFRLPAHVRVTVPPDAQPGNYYLKVSGDCLPLKRWLKVER